MEGNATEFAATMLAFTVALVPLTGIMTIVTPFLMRRGEVFAVTVPDTAAHDPYLRRLKRRYALLMATLTAVLTAVGAFGAFTGHAGLALAVLCVGMLLLCIGSYGLMLYFRSKVRSYKKEQGWQASARAVSYTHLDVYKRQPSTPASPSWNAPRRWTPSARATW